MKRYIIQTAVTKKRLMLFHQDNQREVRKTYHRLIEEMNIIYNGIKESKSYKKAMNSPFKHEWIKAGGDDVSRRQLDVGTVRNYHTTSRQSAVNGFIK